MTHLPPSFTDNCAGQFKSQFCAAKLRDLVTVLGLGDIKVDHIYYEPDHGQLTLQN